MMISEFELPADEARSTIGSGMSAGGTVAWVVPAAGGQTVMSEEFCGPEMAEVFRRSGGEGPVRGACGHGSALPAS